MVRKIIVYVLLGLLAIILVKSLFFSGTARPYANHQTIKKATEPGYVWASAGEHYSRGKFGKFLLGKHYRNVWAVPIKVPVLNLATMHGGLLVGEMGGGMQTTSLNLQDKKGNTYALRSLDKDPIQVLPPFLQKSIVANLIRDQISAANPYAALVVAKLAEAAGIFHANPQLVFVPASDKKLQHLSEKVGNKIFLLEEKYASVSAFNKPFGNAEAILNSVDMLDNRFRFHSHHINQLTYAQCRLFDILIGDWDRHEGQWNWAAYRSGEEVWYSPIPKDRDQAFSKYQDGLIPWLLTRDFAMRKFGNFGEYPEDVVAYTINASFLDERALNAITLTDFKKIAQELQRKLTDAVIDEAVKQFPPPVYEITGAETSQILKSRRNQLSQLAESFYRVLAKKVVVAGSDEKEKFILNRLNDNQTRLRIYQITETDSIGKLIYSRTFSNAYTQEITLHGLAGEDTFEVTGKVNSGPKINLVGGLGTDNITDNSLVANAKNKTVVYDTKKGNNIIWGSQTQDKTTDDIAVHLYDREGF